MKQGIHPEVHLAQATCTGCGNTFQTLSVLPTLTVSICANCHPFFTGTKKLVDTEGRIDKFKRRREGSGSSAGAQQGSTKREQEKQNKAKQRAQRTSL